MPITSIHLENFRAFETSTEISIRPLTVVFGRNSSGKSSLLRSVPLIAESANQPRATGLNLFGNAARGATFADLRCRSSARSDVILGIEFDTKIDPALPTEMRYTIQELTRTKRQVIQKIEIGTQSSGANIFEWILPDDETTIDHHRYLWKSEHGDQEIHLDFAGLSPISTAAAHRGSVLGSLRHGVDTLHGQTHWLGAIRESAKRLYRLGGPPINIEPDGDGFAGFLAHDHINGGDLINGVSRWIKKIASCTLSVNRIAGTHDEYFTLGVCPLEAPSQSINLLDTGEGLTQVLPILTLLTMVQCGVLGPAPLIILEQPELHLQAGIHNEIAKLLCEVCTKAPQARIITETHSGNLILQLQIEIAAGRLDPKDVVLHFVNQQDGRASISQIEFDESARPVPYWPPGFFSEHVELARTLITTRGRI